MSKSSGGTKRRFVLDLEISFNPNILKKNKPLEYDSDSCISQIGKKETLDKKERIAVQIYNALLGEAHHRLNALWNDREYQVVSAFYKDAVSKEDKEGMKQIGIQIGEIKERIGYTKYSLQKYAAMEKHQFKDALGIDECQKLSDRAFYAVEKVRKGQAKKVNFHRWDDDISIEGKSSNSTLKYIGDLCIQFGHNNIYPLIMKPKDKYAIEAMKNKVKYVRLVRRTIRGRKRYYAQLVLEGVPPKKKNLKYGDEKSKVGLDEGVSTIAIASDKEVSLKELAPESKEDWKKIRVIQRAMDRSRRAMNPNNYNEDGTIKKGKKTWVNSKRYDKLALELKEAYRLSACNRRCSHNALANYIVSLGQDIRVENMNIKGLAKRSKATTVNKKNGKINSKKRFGKTIGSRAPAMLITIIDRKLSYIGQGIKKIKTAKVKASQYDHKSDSYKVKQIAERWHVFTDGTRVQRDLYSAFLIMNTTSTLDRINKNKCKSTFDKFYDLAQQEVTNIKESGNKTLAWYVR